MPAPVFLLRLGLAAPKQCRLAEMVEKFIAARAMACCWMVANPPLIDDLAHKSIWLIVHRHHGRRLNSAH